MEEFIPTLQNDREQKLFNMVKDRTNEDVEKWVSNLSCPVIRVDGMKSVKENVELLVTALSKGK